MCSVGRNLSFIAKGCAMLQQKSKMLHDKILYCHEYLLLSRPCIFVVKYWSILQRKTKSLHNKWFYCHKKSHIGMEEDFVVKTNPAGLINFLRRLISGGHEAQQNHMQDARAAPISIIQDTRAASSFDLSSQDLREGAWKRSWLLFLASSFDRLRGCRARHRNSKEILAPLDRDSRRQR
jgi:hypothetical protein